MNINYIKQVLFRPKTFKSLISILLSQPRPLKFLMSRFLWASGLCQLLKIQRNGYFLRFYPTSLSAELWIDREERLDEELFFRRYLRDGDNVIDIGANIGNLTITACQIVGDRGKVYSIEAHPQIYKYLQGNIEVNNLLNVEIFNCAIGENSKNICFSSINSDDQNRVLIAEVDRGINVSMVSLDELAISSQEINLLKVDVEGYEKFVFEGASSVLTHTHCIYFECFENNFSQFGYKTIDVINSLNQKGFKCFKFTDNFTLDSLPNEYISEKCENLIAVKNMEKFLARTNLVCMATNL